MQRRSLGAGALLATVLVAGCSDSTGPDVEGTAWEGSIEQGDQLEIIGVNGAVQATLAAGQRARVTTVKRGQSDDPEQADGQLTAILAVTVDTSSLIRGSLFSPAAAQCTGDLDCIVTSKGSDARGLLYNSLHKTLKGTAEDLETLFFSELYFTVPMDLGGQDWRFIYRPSAESRAVRGGIVPYIVLAAAVSLQGFQAMARISRCYSPNCALMKKSEILLACFAHQSGSSWRYSPSCSWAKIMDFASTRVVFASG